MLRIVLAGAILGLMACNLENPTTEDRCVLSFRLQDSVAANIEAVISADRWTLYNGKEAISLTAMDDQTYRVPVFNGTINLESETKGYWVDSLRPADENGPYRVDFDVLPYAKKPSQAISGTWDLWFGQADTARSARAQLDLVADSDRITGTVRTPTGDYRFLSGNFNGHRLILQTFDGSHLFRFDADLKGEGWTNGHFYSGNHYETSWSGKPSTPWASHVELKNSNPPLDSLIVRYFDGSGVQQHRSLLPPTGKVQVVDILGTWCPNCMDEVRLLTALDNSKAELLSVAFERPKSAEQAYERIHSFHDEMGISWDVLWGGGADKQVAADAFPFLDQVISFPTTLFIQSDGTVHVHSGFNGPATGKRYLEEQVAFELHSTPATSLENR